MIGDHDQPAAGSQAAGRAVEEFLQRTHFLVHLDAEGLVDLREDLVLGSFREHGGDGGVELPARADGLLGAGFRDEAGHPAGTVHFAVEAEDLLEAFRRLFVEEVGGGPGGGGVHPHVQRGVETEGEAALRRVELVRGNAQVGENAVELHAFLAGVVLDETEIVVDEGEAAVLNGRGLYGVHVTVEGDDLPARV